MAWHSSQYLYQCIRADIYLPIYQCFQGDILFTFPVFQGRSTPHFPGDLRESYFSFNQSFRRRYTPHFTSVSGWYTPDLFSILEDQCSSLYRCIRVIYTPHLSSILEDQCSSLTSVSGQIHLVYSSLFPCLGEMYFNLYQCVFAEIHPSLYQCSGEILLTLLVF